MRIDGVVVENVDKVVVGVIVDDVIAKVAGFVVDEVGVKGDAGGNAVVGIIVEGVI